MLTPSVETVTLLSLLSRILQRYNLPSSISQGGTTRVADPHHFFADPDPFLKSFHFNADLDLTFHFYDPIPNHAYFQSITYFLFSYTLYLVIFENVELPHNYFSVIGRFVTGGLPNDFVESVLRAIAESYKGFKD